VKVGNSNGKNYEMEFFKLKKLILVILSVITLFSTISPGLANEIGTPLNEADGLDNIYQTYDDYDDDKYDDDYIPDGWYDPEYGDLGTSVVATTPEETDGEEDSELEETAPTPEEELPISRQSVETISTVRHSGVITRVDISMHENHDTSSPVIRTLAANTNVRITGRLGDMYRIRHNSTTGWVSRNHVVPTRQISIVRDNNVAVRASRSDDARRLTTVNRNQRLTVTRRTGTWSRVTVNNQTGWIRNTQLATTNGRRPGHTISSTGIHIRPDRNSHMRRELPANQEFMIIQRTASGNGAHNGWTQIQIRENGRTETGWIRTDQVRRGNQDRRITGGNAPFRAGPSSNYTRLRTINNGTQVRVLAERGNWSHVRVRVNGRNEYGWIANSRLTDSTDLFDDILAYGQQYLGRPWTAGGSHPNTGFDCSGFIQWIYSVHGINLPRTAQGQFNHGTAISNSNARPGDLVFFEGTYVSNSRITHVGMYVGGGRMLHVGSNRGVEFSPATTGWWAPHFVGFRRVIN